MPRSTDPRHDDPLLAAVAQGHLVFCEESARDGAQAKTLMGLAQRRELVERHARLLGAHSFDQLVFVAGFPAVCPQEADMVSALSEEVESAQMMAVCRNTPGDMQAAAQAVRSARQGRLLVICALTEPTAATIHHSTRDEAIAETAVQVAVIRKAYPEVFVDIALVDAFRADPQAVSRAGRVLYDAGASGMMLCDTVGSCPPRQVRSLVEDLLSAEPGLAWGVHIHNDLGLALAGTLEALAAGVRYVASSWLGIAERAGMVATEQLLLNLALEPASRPERLGMDAPPWPVEPDLTGIPPLAKRMSGWLDLPLKVTDPVIGTGVNTLSTGLPSRCPEYFLPYDPERVLGLPPEPVITHLSSPGLLRRVAAARGWSVDRAQSRALSTRIKDHCYAHSCAIVSDETFRQLVQAVTEPPKRPVLLRSPMRVVELDDPNVVDAVLDATRTGAFVLQLPSVFGLVARGTSTGARQLDRAKQRLPGKTYGSLMGARSAWHQLAPYLDDGRLEQLSAIENCFVRCRIGPKTLSSAAVRAGTHQLIRLPAVYRALCAALERQTALDYSLYGGRLHRAPLASSWNLSGDEAGSITCPERALELARQRDIRLVVLAPEAQGSGSYPIVEWTPSGPVPRRQGPGLQEVLDLLGTPPQAVRAHAV